MQLFSTLQIWAFRDILRRPFESILMAAALVLTIGITGTLLLFPRAVYDTVDKILGVSPAIIVRRINATGWQPMPVKEAIKSAEGVVGVVSVKPRVWAVVNGPDGPLTIFGVVGGDLSEIFPDQQIKAPDRGQAIVGPGVMADKSYETLQLENQIRNSYRVIHRLPKKTSIFSHDLVILDAADARELLGIPEGYASDLAIDVFHEDEQEAILPDLTAAFPWPVRCITRRHSVGAYSSELNRRAALGGMAFIPAVLTVCLLVAVNIRKSMGRQSDLGIMKAVGWTTGDIVRLQLYKTMFICMPSAAAGMGISFLLVYGPGGGWMAKLFLGWESIPPNLYLHPKGALTVLLELSGYILAPVIAAALTPSIKSATVTAHDLIEGAGSR